MGHKRIIRPIFWR